MTKNRVRPTVAAVKKLSEQIAALHHQGRDRSSEISSLHKKIDDAARSAAEEKSFLVRLEHDRMDARGLLFAALNEIEGPSVLTNRIRVFLGMSLQELPASRTQAALAMPGAAER